MKVGCLTAIIMHLPQAVLEVDIIVKPWCHDMMVVLSCSSYKNTCLVRQLHHEDGLPDFYMHLSLAVLDVKPCCRDVMVALSCSS